MVPMGDEGHDNGEAKSSASSSCGSAPSGGDAALPAGEDAEAGETVELLSPPPMEVDLKCSRPPSEGGRTTNGD